MYASVADSGYLSRIPGPDFHIQYPSRIPNPGSRIPDLGSQIPDSTTATATKTRGKVCSHKYHNIKNYFIFEQVQKNFKANSQRNIVLFTQQIVTKPSKLWVCDPGSGIRKTPIPDPGEKRYRIPDPDPQH
jgi:hypothetical protein